MDITVANLEAIIPTFIAIMGLVMFSPKTRWLSYAVVLLSIGAELIPLTINTTALFASISCFLGLLAAEYIHAHDNLDKPIKLFSKQRS